MPALLEGKSSWSFICSIKQLKRNTATWTNLGSLWRQRVFQYILGFLWPSKTTFCRAHVVPVKWEYFNTLKSNHRLNGSSSPVLTATCLSYGSLCDFLGFFHEPTWRSHPLTDFDVKWLKRRGFTQGRAFWSKNRNFLKPLTPKTAKICPVLVGT